MGSKSYQTSSKPPAYIQSAQQSLIGQAQNVASTPYKQYTGSLVAPLNATQNAAISGISGLQGVQNPYLNSASNLFQSGSQVNPNQISAFENPYQSQVINATTAQMANLDAINNNNIVGNAIAQGAWGGDRTGVAQGIAAGQEALANNQTLAGLNSQNYSQALQAAQNNAQLQQQAGYGQGALGTEAVQTGLANLSGQLQAGGVQQQQQQNVLNTGYQQWLNQQQYPFQTTNFLSGVVNGTAGLSGITNTQPGPSVLSQVAGAASLALPFFLKRGGRVARDIGGGVGGNVPQITPIQTYVPMGMGAMMMPEHFSPPQGNPSNSGNNPLQSLGALASLFQGGGGSGAAAALPAIPGLSNGGRATRQVGGSLPQITPVQSYVSQPMQMGFGGMMPPEIYAPQAPSNAPQGNMQQDMGMIASLIKQGGNQPGSLGRMEGYGNGPTNMQWITPKQGANAATVLGNNLSNLWNGLKTGGRVARADGGNLPYGQTTPDLSGQPVNVVPLVPQGGGFQGMQTPFGIDPLQMSPFAMAANAQHMMPANDPSAPVQSFGYGNSGVERYMANPATQFGLSLLSQTSPWAGVNLGRAGLATIQQLQGQRMGEIRAQQMGAATQGAELHNEMTGLMLKGYQNLYNYYDNSSPETQAARLSNEAAKTSGAINKSTTPPPEATAVPAPNAIPVPVGAAPVVPLRPGMPMPPPAGAASAGAAPQGVPMPPQPQATLGAPGAPSPVLNPQQLSTLYRLTAPIPGMQNIAASALNALTKIQPEGMYYGTDGQIHPYPGFIPNEAALKGAEAGSQAWAKVAPNLYESWNEPHSITPRTGQTFASPIQVQSGAVPPVGGGNLPSPLAGAPNGTIQPAPIPNAGPVQSPSNAQSPYSLASMLRQAPPVPQNMAGNETGYQIQKDVLPAQYKQAESAYNTALQTQQQLGEMERDFSSLGTSGMMAPGTGASTRADFIKTINSFAQAAGGQPILDPNKIASWEDLNKNSTRLGFGLARSLGSREAQMIVQQATAAVPNMGNTPLGAQRVISALDAAAQRDKDYYTFMQQYAAQHNGNTFGADIVFNKTRSPQLYAQYAEIPLAAKAELRANATNPVYTSSFAKHFGQGALAIALEQ